MLSFSQKQQPAQVFQLSKAESDVKQMCITEWHLAIWRDAFLRYFTLAEERSFPNHVTFKQVFTRLHSLLEQEHSIIILKWVK